MVEIEDKDKVISIDLDGDGVADIILNKTNGHTVFINVKSLVAVITSICGAGGLLYYLV
jgi:hypothetical protein